MKERDVEKLLSSTIEKFDFDEELVEIMYQADKEKRENDDNYSKKVINSLSDELKLVITQSKIDFLMHICPVL